MENVCCYLQVSKIFGNFDLFKQTLSCIDRFFTQIVETNSFLELEFKLVKKILSSSQLLITAEEEIFNSVDAWIKHNTKEQSLEALELLKTIRLSLLSLHVLENSLSENFSFSRNTDCVVYIKEIINNKKTKDTKTSILQYQHRYCSQDNFDHIVFGDYNHYIMNIYIDKKMEIKCENVKALAPMITPREHFRAVYCGGEVYILGGYVDAPKDIVMSIEKYSPFSKKWSEVATMPDERGAFSSCAFMNKVFVLGGCTRYIDCLSPYSNSWTRTCVTEISSCLVFDTKNFKWKEVASLNVARDCSACCVFQGQVVVSGGCGHGGTHSFNSVELFDHVSNEWTFLPNMLESRFDHTSIAIKNKLFMIAGGVSTCEVFDSYSKQFSLISPKKLFDCEDQIFAATSIGSKVIFISLNSVLTEYFDSEKNIWVGDPCELDEDTKEFSCVKIPKF